MFSCILEFRIDAYIYFLYSILLFGYDLAKNVIAYCMALAS